MRNILPLIVVLSCSPPEPAAHSQPADAQPSQAQPDLSPPKKSPPLPEKQYLNLMGVELWPTAMAEPMPSYEVEVTKKALADILPQFKVRCDETELKSLRSLPSYYRLVDAEATAFLEDAKKIGWRFQQVKAWDDVVVYQARWHAQSRAVVFDFQPARLSIGVCRLVPIAPAPAAKPAR